jgi:23S rRNA (cytidine1920-2'-O)/16S rRNA (cytidine1409-2'-O)-methyltransferase
VAKERIDVLLTEKGLAPSREKAKILVMAGAVFVADQRVTKPDFKVDFGQPIEVRSNPIPYVSFGGMKLEKALKELKLTVQGKIALDIGSSTGGFCDCLLSFGAAKVYGVDVGTGQLHDRLRRDNRVVLLENTNARYLSMEQIGEKADIITVDVSFISLKKIIPALTPMLKPDGYLLSLVKPQFEVGRYEVGKGGIVRSLEKIERVLEEIRTFGRDCGLRPRATIEAPRDRERKNREYFILWVTHEHQDQ